MPFSHKAQTFNRPLQPSAFPPSVAGLLRRTGSLQPNHGFTLIELIVTLVLLGILASVAGFGIVEVARGYAAARENERMAQTARIALLRMSRGLMELESVQSAGPSAIAVTDPDGNQIAIGLYGTQVLLDDDASAADGETLLDRVASFQLSYDDFDGSPWTPAMPADQLAGIDIQLSLSRTDGMDPIGFSTYINPRNNGTGNAPY